MVLVYLLTYGFGSIVTVTVTITSREGCGIKKTENRCVRCMYMYVYVHDICVLRRMADLQ